MLQYLGQILDSQGVRKDLSKVKAIVGMTEPKDTGDLRRFLGLVSHLMKFCPNLAEKTKLLRDLLKKEKAWVWGPAQQEAFKRLKIEMASENVLALYDPEKGNNCFLRCKQFWTSEAAIWWTEASFLR